MNDIMTALAEPDFMAARDELAGFLQSDHVPPGVKSACFCLYERQKELFCWVPEVEGATRAPRLLPGLHASDYLRELLVAFRALDWPQVLILVHRPIPPRFLNDTSNAAKESNHGE